MSLEVLFWIGWILYQGKCQDESFASLDWVEVWYNRFGETLHGDTTKATVSSMKGQRLERSNCEWHTGRHMESRRDPGSSLRYRLRR